ncbi:MAG: hypothetical protein OEZ10_13615 [Gammaproteobacteria bacterium]|nr:hypothetical protein [Gammaproteobacteria bacterium]
MDTGSALENFKLDGMMRYSVFVPRLYNFCKSLGMETGKIMPSRAFCSDENQGYPVILIAKHFGTFPFNHGQVGGIVATDRHGPHAHHGDAMVIIQACHVGYDPETKSFGVYRRLQTSDNCNSTSCGKVDLTLQWYRNEYDFAHENIFIGKTGNRITLTIDNQLLRDDRHEGLFLRLNRLLAMTDGGLSAPVSAQSTSRTYFASDDIASSLAGLEIAEGSAISVGSRLTAQYFYYRKDIAPDIEGRDHLEANLLNSMPRIVTSRSPLLAAAQINSQIEFDRTFRTIAKNHDYAGKFLVFISGIHIDISPKPGQLFPLTKYVPWAAYVQKPDGSHHILEQAELLAELRKQSTDNPDQIQLDQAIHVMEDAQEVRVEY